MAARVLVRAFVGAASALTTVAAQAQCPQYTPGFHGGGFDAEVFALESFDDGTGVKLFAGGSFQVAGDAAASRVAMWNGERWSGLGEGVGSTVRALCVHDDGSGDALFVGGGFQMAGGQPASRVAKWNGSSWSALGAGLSGGLVRDLVRFDDGGGAALYAAGGFTSSGGASVQRVARWNGAQWTQLGAGLGDLVLTLAEHDDGSGAALFAGGVFPGGVARWDGVAWQTIGAPLGVGAEVRDLVSYDDGAGTRWLVAIGASMLGDSVVARWDGASWTSMLTSLPGSLAHCGVVRDEAGETALYLGAQQELGFVRRWSPSSGWVEIVDLLADGVPLAIGFHDDGSGHGEELYVGGQFTLVNCSGSGGIDAQRIARFDGSLWRELQRASPHSLKPPCSFYFHAGAFPHPEARALARWRDPSDGRVKLVLGGRFLRPSDDPQIGGVATWDGVKWQALAGMPISMIDGLTTWTDPTTQQELLIGLSWDFATFFQPTNVGAFDGANWTALGQTGPLETTCAIAWQAPGAAFEELYVGASNPYRGEHLSRWDGSAWQGLGAGPDGPCHELAIFDPPGAQGPGLYVAGEFLTVGGAPMQHIARWDGTQWSALPPAMFGLPGDPDPIRALAVFDDGAGENLFVGADHGLWRFDGVAWTQYATPDRHTAAGMTVYDDGSGPALYMGGGMRYRNGQLSSYAPHGPLSRELSLLAFEDEFGGSKALWFAGEFDAFGPIPSRGVARWSDPCSTPIAYCTAKVNSLGCTPAIGWSGEPSVSQAQTTPFVISASNVLNQRAGLMFYGVFGRLAVPFQGGFQCVRLPVLRTPVRSSGGSPSGADCSGTYELDFTPWLTGALDPLLAPGVIARAQWWSRDAASPSGTGLTDALEFEVRP